jgi:hypothetical protein
MKNYHPVLVAVILIVGVFLGQAVARPLVLGWDDLVPAKGKGMNLSVPKNGPIIGALKREEFSEFSKEEFEAFASELEAPRLYQPQGSSIRTDLNGKTVRIAGYITPVEIDGVHVTGFLLVPYVGACIHVPSPPGNQIIYVSKVKGLTLDEIDDPVWVTGKLQAKPLTTILADVGYRIISAKIAPYKE